MENNVENAQDPKRDLETRNKIVNLVTSTYRNNKEKFDKECLKYIDAFSQQFNGIFPEHLLKSDRVDVNVIYQVIQSIVPVVYFKNPKVFVKSLQEKIVKTVTTLVTDENGEEVEQPVIENGQPVVEEYDGPHAALSLQAAINENIAKADLKGETKAAIKDALLTFYGAIKSGFGNDQGVASMGEEGAPPSIREEVNANSAYGIRLTPWDVIVDPVDFYHPSWIAVRYAVPPEQLQNDTRLNYRDKIKGNTKLDDKKLSKTIASDPEKETPLAEYFEVFYKPCAKYPEGKYFIFSEEVKDGFLYESDWPTKSKTFPVKILYFVRDPRNDLPIPPMRYLIGHQKAKANLRNTEYEYVQRTLPFLIMNTSAMKDGEKAKQQIESSQVPRVLTATQPPERAVGQASFPALSSDFRMLEANLDNDVAKVSGITGTVAPSTNQDQLATGLKIAANTEQVRQQELADAVSDFVKSILEHWVDLYKEFAPPENFSAIDGEKFPVAWSRDQIQGDFKLEIKPFSMSYEDPVIVRRQFIDLLNLLASPDVQAWVKEQGYYIDAVKILTRIFETYEERDINNFIRTELSKPEMQVMDALKENEALATGDPTGSVAVLPEDNHKLHIILHSLIGPAGAKHTLEHQQAMQGAMPMGSPGGGNSEGLPTNGVAVNQEMLRQPLNPSPTNSETAIRREATKTR